MIKDLIQKFIKPEQKSLKIQSIRAAGWTVVGKVLGRSLSLISSLILTRILFPKAFGLMATAIVAVTMVKLFSDTGVNVAIIQC